MIMNTKEGLDTVYAAVKYALDRSQTDFDPECAVRAGELMNETTVESVEQQMRDAIRRHDLNDFRRLNNLLCVGSGYPCPPLRGTCGCRCHSIMLMLLEEEGPVTWWSQPADERAVQAWRDQVASGVARSVRMTLDPWPGR